MSKYFTSDDERERVEFDDGSWVDVKPELTQEDQDYIMAHLLKAKGNDVELVAGQLPLLERSILAWSFDAPVNKSNISKLKLRYRSKVLVEVNRLNTEAMDFVKKNPVKA